MAEEVLSAPNVYEMFVANGCEVGFWLTRTTWRNLYARVTFVGEFKAAAPCFGNPPVRGDLYFTSSGELKQANAGIPGAGDFQDMATDFGATLGPMNRQQGDEVACNTVSISNR